MEQFPDGAHVRLQSRIEGAYVYANEDGYGVSMSPHGASLNAVWAVHRLVRRGTSYVLLHGAAYGRYLSITREDAPRGYGRIVQRLYDDPRRRDFLWVPVEDEDGTGDVVMHNRRHGPWRRFEHPDEEISWMVEAIPPRQDPPELPPAVPVSSPSPSALNDLGGAGFLENLSEFAIFLVSNYSDLMVGFSSLLTRLLVTESCCHSWYILEFRPRSLFLSFRRSSTVGCAPRAQWF
jgi:hypothetical protein